ncbi:MAG: baseplate J/gp47 family protein [Anaerolineales bacterium]|jgi:hypothetical protein
MRVQIIYLDPQDDHVSARDKLSWLQVPYVALVWPSQGRVLTRRLDLVLLQRYARQRGAQLGLVTYDAEIAQHAADLGIPVFQSLDNLEQQSWHPTPKRHRRQPAVPTPKRDRWRLEDLTDRRQKEPAGKPRAALRWAIFGLALASVLMLVGTIGPSARVVLQPETQVQEKVLAITLDRDAISPNDQGRIPAVEVHLRLIGDMQQPTTGRVALPSTRAVGTVVFTNLTSEPITLPAGTGVRTISEPAVRFATTQTVQLSGNAGATVSASVRAVEPGLAGNLEAGSLRAIDGRLGLSASVDNPEPTQGGEDEIRAAVATADQLSLEQALTEQLIARAAAAHQETLGEGEVIASQSMTVSRIYSRHYDHQVGEAADSLSLTLDVELVGLVHRQADLEQAAEMALQAELPAGWQLVPGSLQLELLSNTLPGHGDLTGFLVALQQEIFQPIDLTPLSRALQGLKPEQASALVEGEFGVTVSSIDLWPQWWPWLPWLHLRIIPLWSWEAP